jgi:hypothetical protein
MIKPAEAMAAAIKMVLGVYADKKPSDFMLEEIEFDKAQGYWIITLSFYMYEGEPPGAITIATLVGGAPRPVKFYKSFHVDGSSGEVLKMSIRNV